MSSDEEYLQQIRNLLSGITLPPWETGKEKTGGYMEMPVVAPKDPEKIMAIGYMIFPIQGGPVAFSLMGSPEFCGNRQPDTAEQAMRNADFIAQAPSMISFLLNYIDTHVKNAG
ncbi:MAG: hypothetical protein HND47_19695 [Chloroflexi bacterium]|nr:hypothetical protein [Chloroflexota bacterium]NOH04030.1 hypothetical protein [Chloroflexota bacterium]